MSLLSKLKQNSPSLYEQVVVKRKQRRNTELSVLRERYKLEHDNRENIKKRAFEIKKELESL